MLAPPLHYFVANNELPFRYWCAISNTLRLIALSTYQSVTLQTELMLDLIAKKSFRQSQATQLFSTDWARF